MLRLQQRVLHMRAPCDILECEYWITKHIWLRCVDPLSSLSRPVVDDLSRVHIVSGAAVRWLAWCKCLRNICKKMADDINISHVLCKFDYVHDGLCSIGFSSCILRHTAACCDWLSYGFTFHSTQNSSFLEMFFPPNLLTKYRKN